MKLNADVFNRAEFLSGTWQQQPRLLRAGFPAFEDPVEAEILAGLAMEDGVDSRIVQCRYDADGKPTDWHVEHGPFSDYESYGESNWTLLVQSVNEWLPQVGSLLSAFEFLPEWRLDDVMVSFSCEGGGVGPHLDQYDVFIIQGSGRRRWRVGQRQAMTSYQPCTDLTLVEEPFDAVIDEVLEPGDVLYIPAGCPHDGVALEPSLNYSVGFRAPSQAEWLLQLGDQALQHDVLNRRYQDPQLQPDTATHEVSDTQLAQCKQLLADALQGNGADDLLMRIMSQSKRELVEPELPYVAEQIPELLQQQGAIIARAPGARWLYSASLQSYYSGGERFQLNPAIQPLAEALAGLRQEAAAEPWLALVNNDNACQLLADLLNLGTFVLFLETD